MSRFAAQILAAVAMAATAHAVALTTPAHKLAQPQRTGAALAIVLGALILPAAFIVSAARDSQP